MIYERMSRIPVVRLQIGGARLSIHSVLSTEGPR